MGLQPEKRRDKNGRLVTRHVRSSPLPETQGKVPAPRISEIDSSYLPMTTLKQLAFYEAVTAFSAWRDGSLTRNLELERWRNDVPLVHQRIIDASMPILTRYADTMDVIKTVQNLITNRSLAESTDDVCMQIRIAAVESYYEKSIRPFNHAWAQWVAKSHVFLATGYDIDDDTPDEDQVTQIVALAHVLVSASIAGLKGDALREAEFKMALNENTDLVEVTLANTDRAEDIAAFIQARGTADVKLVQEFLNNDSAAIVDGIL